MLMKRAFKFKDPFILKMLRNISQHDDLDLKMKFVVSHYLCSPDPYSRSRELSSLVSRLHVVTLSYYLTTVKSQLLPGLNIRLVFFREKCRNNWNLIVYTQ